MMIKRYLVALSLLFWLAVPALADTYIYSSERTMNVYYVCEDFDGAIPAALEGVFDSRLRADDEILCGTLRETRYHSDPDAVKETDALLALRREGKILLLGASRADGAWQCALETDSFFAPGQRFDVTVLPDHGESGRFTGASLALVCGEEEFWISVKQDGMHLTEYRAPQTDGSMLEIGVDDGSLYAGRYKDGVLQESGSAKGILSGRLCGWTYGAFPKSCTQVNALEGAGLTAFDADEVMIFGVNLRERPTGESHSLGKYTAKVRVLGREEGLNAPWYQVQVGDTTGWVSGTYVCWPGSERAAFSIAAYLSETPGFAKTRREAARHTMLRAAPDGEAIRQLPAGTIMQVISESDGWLHVILPKAPGWMMDWDGTYGYVRADDVITGVSLTDIQYE